jgi:hypothetical protein
VHNNVGASINTLKYDKGKHKQGMNSEKYALPCYPIFPKTRGGTRGVDPFADMVLNGGS